MGRGSNDLLEARLREQTRLNLELQSQLNEARRESKSLRRELLAVQEQISKPDAKILPAEYSETVSRVTSIRLHPMLTGTLNEYESAKDNILSVVMMPLDEQGDVVKVAGTVVFRLFDAREKAEPVGEWKFTAAESAENWTKSFWGSGYQFKLPFQAPPTAMQMVLKAEFTTADQRTLEALQVLRIRGADGTTLKASAHRMALPTAHDKLPKFEPRDRNRDDPPVRRDREVPLPPDPDDEPGPLTSKRKPAARVLDDEEPPEPVERMPRVRKPLRDSTRWTDAEIPILR